MTIYAYDSGGTRRTANLIYAYDSSGTRRTVTTGYTYDSSGNRKLIYAAVNAQSVQSLVIAIWDGSTKSANCSFKSDGTCDNDPGTTFDFTWLPGGNPADFDLYVSGTGDALTTGTLDTWLNLGTTRTFGYSASQIGTLSFSGTYQIRHSSSGTVLASNTIAIELAIEQ